MIRIVFFSFLWVLVFPLSVWADGKGTEASVKVTESGKSDADSGPPKQTEQPVESGKKEGKSSGLEETAKVTEAGKSDAEPAQPKQTEPATVSSKNESKANETGETAKLTEVGKSEAKSGSLKQTELTAKSGKKDSESGQPEKGLLSVGKKSERDLLQSKGEEAKSEKRDSLGAKEGTKLKVSDPQSVSKDKEITTKVGKGKKDSAVPIIRTLEAIAEKDGSYLFAGKILADGGSAVLAAGIELSPDMKFKKTTKLAFSLQDGESSYRVKTKKLGAGTRVFYRAYLRNSEESNLGSVKRLKVPESDGKGGWWSEGEKMSGGWRKSKWFGSFRKQEDMEWVYHEKLGWTYVVSDQRDGLWLWQKENGWTWTQKGVWPCLWRNKTGSWLCLMGAYQGKAVFYDYASRKVKNRTEKQGEKVSEKTIDLGKSVDSKTTEAKAKVSAENKSEASTPLSTGQNGKDAGQNEKAKVSDAREPDSSRSDEKQAGNKEKEPDAKISDKKEAAPTDPRKNDAPARQSASSNLTTGDGQAGESKEKTRESTGSKEDDSSPPETSRSVDEAGEKPAGNPTKTNTQKSSR